MKIIKVHVEASQTVGTFEFILQDWGFPQESWENLSEDAKMEVLQEAASMTDIIIPVVSKWD